MGSHLLVHPQKETYKGNVNTLGPRACYDEGTQTRSFCYVRDLIAGMYKLMNNDHFQGPVNIGNPTEITIKELAKKELNWEPKVDIETGLQKTIKYFEALVEQETA